MAPTQHRKAPDKARPPVEPFHTHLGGKSHRCRVTGQGIVALPAALYQAYQREGVTILHAGLRDGRMAFTPLDRAAAAMARLSPFLVLAELDLSSACALVEADFGTAAAKAFPVDLACPVPGPVSL